MKGREDKEGRKGGGNSLTLLCVRLSCVRLSGVRMDRVRGGRQKYKRRVESGLSSYCRASYLHPVSSEF